MLAVSAGRLPQCRLWRLFGNAALAGVEWIAGLIPFYRLIRFQVPPLTRHLRQFP